MGGWGGFRGDLGRFRGVSKRRWGGCARGDQSASGTGRMLWWIEIFVAGFRGLGMRGSVTGKRVSVRVAVRAEACFGVGALHHCG